jgi:hypothetical protein
VWYKPVLRGRVVWGIDLFWDRKLGEHLAETALEQERASPGRKARRDGTTEILTIPAPELAKPKTDDLLEFPSAGSLEYTPWRKIALAQLPEPARDIDLVANDFRAWAERGNKPLKGHHVVKMFEGFCRGQKPA